MSMIINKDFCVSSNLFTWVPEEGTLVSELSCFNETEILRRIYDDAVDVGMVVLSERTGATEVFYFAEQKRDPSGELVSLGFKPINPALADKGLKIVLFND